MGKEEKTNVSRILERAGIPFRQLTYDCGEFEDGIHAAEKAGTPPELTYKTLVLTGKSGKHYVCVIPIAEEINLKAAAKAVGEKSMEMLPLKLLTETTGYIRGGCSPVGMKKQFPTVIDSAAEELPDFYVSGGRVGVSVSVNPKMLAGVVHGIFAPIAEKQEREKA